MNENYNEYLSNERKILMFRTQINFNVTSLTRSADYIKNIIWHGTGNTKADDYQHYKYFKSANRDSSADFFVDHDSITKLNDYYKGYTWHIGDRPLNRLKTPGVLNKNSIGIEICMNLQGKAQDKAIENAIELVLELQKWIGKKRNLRHFDVTGKYCPADILVDHSRFIHPRWKEILKIVG